MDLEDNGINASAQKEQGREAGINELVAETKKVDPGTVVEPLPLPYEPIVSTFYVEDREERTQDAQRKGIPVDTVISGTELTTPQPFTGRSPPPDHLPSHWSRPVSQSSTVSSDKLETLVQRLDLANGKLLIHLPSVECTRSLAG